MTEVLELGALNFDVFTTERTLIDTVFADGISDGGFEFFAVLVPAFVIDPDIMAIAEKFATMTGRNGAKQGGAEL